MSDTPKTVPLSISSPMADNWSPEVWIGSDSISFGGKPSLFGGYWLVVVDRKTLQVVYNQYTENYDGAPDLGQYDTTDYMLVVTAVHLGTGHVPQSAFYDFLWDQGAGRGLKRIVQLNDTIGCGSYGTVSYILVGVLGEGRPGLPGVEGALVEYNPGGLVMTAELVPVDIGGVTYYSPSPLSD